ncbi:MAG: L,D-transpeptidase [bacterium]|nr:L,D-transpeptidase [bacterium]
MASPPAFDRALAQLRSAASAGLTFTSRHRVATGITGGVIAVGLLTATIMPSMAAADIAPTPTASSSAIPPSASGSTSVADDATAVAVAKPKKPKKPKPASATHKAKNVPDFPRDKKHHGKRIVYDKALMTVWLINKNDQVVARYPVVGRFDRPAKGVYRVFSKSPVAYNPSSKVTFNHMVRFTYGPDTMSPIGLHAIPRYYDGKPMHSVKQLGLAIARGGCVRLSEKAAAHVYKFAKVGDRVVVLPSP